MSKKIQEKTTKKPKKMVKKTEEISQIIVKNVLWKIAKDFGEKPG